MESFVAVVHILVSLVLITLILIQDSKSGSLGGAFGGGGSNSVLGATGATTLAQKMTRWTAAVFAITCIILAVESSRRHRSVIDDVVTNAPATSAPAPAETAPAAPQDPAAPADSSPAPGQ